ncbi:MAG: hypothetical protein WCC17_16550 [Candidatus Nitrosopolaris sp.]
MSSIEQKREYEEGAARTEIEREDDSILETYRASQGILGHYPIHLKRSLLIDQNLYQIYRKPF